MLIGARVVQGLGAALMNPSTLSIITVTFAPKQRGTAIGIWAGVSALALAIGPLVGGVITEHINWNWIFFINIPVGIVAVIAAFLFIDESRDNSAEQRPDVPGLATSALGLFALTYALIEGNSFGWSSTRIIGAFVVAAVSLTAFVLLETHQRLPMLDVSLFRNRTFTGSNLVMLLVALAMFGVFFYISLFMQQVLGYSPTQAGAAFLPLTILIVFLAPLAGKYSDRFGSRYLAGTGMLLLAGSLFLFSRLSDHASYWQLLPAMLVGGTGMALTMTPTTAAAMSAVVMNKAGVGSAVLNSSRQVGGSLGIALIGAIIASSLPAGAAASATGQHLSPEAAHLFTNALHSALEVASLIALAGSLVALVTVRKPVRHDHAAPVAIEA
jgi:EmrB/QacA subfamily drug resistance transporter